MTSTSLDTEELICDDCWEPLDEIDSWTDDGDDHILCSICEEESQWQ